MRDFIDAIFATIGTSSLTDEEFGWVTVESQTYTLTLYAELVMLLDAREAVSNTRDRLKYYFQSRGLEVTTPAVANSKIYFGDDLCS